MLCLTKTGAAATMVSTPRSLQAALSFTQFERTQLTITETLNKVPAPYSYKRTARGLCCVPLPIPRPGVGVRSAAASSCSTGKNLRNSELQNLEKEKVGSAAQPGGERVSEREHERVGREKEGGYSETARRAPKRGREEQQRNGFQVVHIAPVNEETANGEA